MTNAAIAGKPVVYIPGSVLNLRSKFKEKGLCDGPTFSTGIACVYRCSFCYVESYQTMNPQVQQAMSDTSKAFQDLVIRRSSALAKLRESLTQTNGKPKFAGGVKKVIYASPLVDVAANIDLAKETIECCKIIFELTNWDVRLLSKSNLLPYIAKGLPSEFKKRVIFGVSTGTFDDKLALAFEQGTALVSKRLESLYWLQDNGFRTFGMICPSLPQDDYEGFAQEAISKIREPYCENTWAEVLNVRGDSMTRTCVSLEAAGYGRAAGYIRAVSADATAWEEYARSTFLAQSKLFPKGKLSFLQYINPINQAWWKEQIPNGAVLLGDLADKLRKTGWKTL